MSEQSTKNSHDRSWHGRTVVGLGLVSFFNDTHSDAVFALLPQFMRDVLGLSMQAVGLVDGLAQATTAVFHMVSGWVSDRLGTRKPVVMAGYSLSAMAKVLLIWATRPWHVLAVRVSDRIGKGLRTPARDALLADAVQRQQWGRAYGFHRTMDSAGAIAGSALAWGVFAATSSYTKSFAIAGICGGLAVLLLALLVHEGQQATCERGDAISFKGFTTAFWMFAASYVLFSLGRVTYSFFLLRIKDLGAPAALVPGAYLLHNICYTAAGLPMGVLSDRITARWATLVTYLLMAATAAGMAVAGAEWLGFALTALYGVVLAGEGAAVRALAAELVPESR
ncbi:MAG: MFS transporter, partial [Armatimonadetes bacterium]|nr:MFS transporter [Armatimonadota bacterium]